MLASRQNQLKTAFILLKCDNKEHKDCRKIRDALLSRHPNIRTAYTTNARIRGERWCVAATALVSASEAEGFAKEVRAVQTDAARPIGVSNLHFALDDQ